MDTVSIETREEKCRHIGRESVEGVPPGGTATVSTMTPSPSLAKEFPTKKWPDRRM